MKAEIIQGDARRLPLEDNSVDCVVTSPPYWVQRKYRLPNTIWNSEARRQKPECKHRWGRMERGRRKDVLPEDESKAGRLAATNAGIGHTYGGNFCVLCGAWRGQLGLEPTPELYIEHLVECFREARRVLKLRGTCWLVISDSRLGGRGPYTPENSPKQSTNFGTIQRALRIQNSKFRIKPSDMLGLPHDVVKALRADGWYWRDEIIWAKPNGMCESVRSRTTRNHEYVFLLTKSPSPKYFFDVEAIMERCASGPSDIRKMLEYKPRLGGKSLATLDPILKASALTNIGRKRAVGGFLRVELEGVNCRMHQDRDVFHPAARKMRSGNKQRLIGGRGRTGNHFGFNVPWEGLYRRKRSAWWVSVSKPRIVGKHYATFPEKLVEPMILAGCPKGGVVLDPFAGSGTVGVVARRLGRRFILNDLGYQAIQKRRMGAAGASEK